MNAEQFEIEFQKAIAKWVDSGKVGPDPRGEIEHRPYAGWNWLPASREQLKSVSGEFRWRLSKKRTVTVNGVELVAPEVDTMTLRQYAAIKLKVPDSGTDWLDDMIAQSLRDDFAAKAMQGMFAARTSVLYGDAADEAYRMADAMMKVRQE